MVVGVEVDVADVDVDDAVVGVAGGGKDGSARRSSGEACGSFLKSTNGNRTVPE